MNSSTTTEVLTSKVIMDALSKLITVTNRTDENVAKLLEVVQGLNVQFGSFPPAAIDAMWSSPSEPVPSSTESKKGKKRTTSSSSSDEPRKRKRPTKKAEPPLPVAEKLEEVSATATTT